MTDERHHRAISVLPEGPSQVILATATGASALRLLYVLPASDYLGLKSYPDEFEHRPVVDQTPYDIVAFEALKVARLLLKGHLPTLDWLLADPIVSSEGAAEIRRLARVRLERLR